MKNIKKLMVVVLVAAMMFTMVACGTRDNNDNSQPENTQTQQTTTDEGKNDVADPQPTPEAVVTFDAENAVVVEQMQDAVKYTFNTLPENARDIQALIELYPVTDRHNTAAFFMASLVRYIEDEQTGLDMIDELKGPQKLSDTDKSFIKERFSDKKYIPKAYFEGATPENNYEPASPWVVIIYDDPVEPPEGYTYVNVKTSGADSPRRICMRLKGEDNWLWEYNGVFLSIRLPAEEDPWR